MRNFTIMLLAGVICLTATSLFAGSISKGDTLLIGPTKPNGQPVGALTFYIYGDTTDAGEQQHSVYQLYRDSTYILTETLINDFDFELMAYEPDDEHSPPVIRSGLQEDGSTVLPLIQIRNNVTMKNLYISGVSPTGDGAIGWQIINHNTSNKKFVYENCYFEAPFTDWCLFSSFGSHNVIKFEKCVFRNLGNPGQTWNGAVRGSDSAADSVILRHNTYFNFGCCATNAPEDVGVLYTEIEYCTFVNSVVHQFILNKPVIAKVNNNLFVNCHSFSGGPVEIEAHPDQEIHGIIHQFQFDAVALDSVWGDMYDPNGDGTLTEDERVYELKNNNWYYTEPIRNYWANNDTVFAQRWYCDATREFFVDNEEPKEWVIRNLDGDSVNTWQLAAHPMFVEENTMNMEPQFTNIGDSDEMLAQNLMNIRLAEQEEDVDHISWYYDPDGSFISFQWPLPEDLSYSNPTLLTASTDGLPVGDLYHWFPEEYATGVEQSAPSVPAEFALEANYPNPFNPETSIQYRINTAGRVNLTVYNILGEKVKTLVNEKKVAGRYSVTWNGTNAHDKKVSTGVYFYRLEMGDKVQSRKMMLVK